MMWQEVAFLVFALFVGALFVFAFGFYVWTFVWCTVKLFRMRDK